KLVELLTDVETRLRLEGLDDLANQYAPRRAQTILQGVQKLSKSRRHLYLLVRGESVLVDAMLQLGGLGALPPKTRAQKWASFGKKWNYQLRRMYPGLDFTDLAPILLEAAGQSLRLPSGTLEVAGLADEFPEPPQGEIPEIG